MSIEIERKFLVQDNSFKEQAYSHAYIKQGYISLDKDRTVRIRIKNNTAFITIKGRTNESGLSRYEWEKKISIEEASCLLDLALPGIIEKTRYNIKLGEHIWEVDVFEGDNKGLILAEVELKTEKESFILPHFIGDEVTGDIRYYNSYLSQHSFNTW